MPKIIKNIRYSNQIMKIFNFHLGESMQKTRMTSFELFEILNIIFILILRILYLLKMIQYDKIKHFHA